MRVVLALVVALITASPALRLRLEHPDRFAGIEMLGVADGEHHLMRLNRIAHDEYGAANDLLHEHRQAGKQGSPLLSYRLFLLFEPVWPGSLASYTVTMNAIWAGLYFLALLLMARALAMSERVSWAVGLAGTLAPYLFAFHGSELLLFRPSAQLIDFLPVTRPVSPVISSAVLWATFAAAFVYLRQDRLRDLGLTVVGAASGMYLYETAFPLLGAPLVAVAVVELCRRRFPRLVTVLVGGVLALAVQVPALLGFFGGTAEAAERNRENLIAVPSSAPVLTWNVGILCGLALLGVLPAIRRRLDVARRVALWCPAVILLLLYNQQVVTGRLYQPFHYDWFYTTPFIWLAVAVLLDGTGPTVERWVGRIPVTRLRVGATVLVAIVAILAFGGTTTGTWLREVGLIRADRVLRPWVFVGLAGAVAVGVVLLPVWIERRKGWARDFTTLVLTLSLLSGWMIQADGYERRDGMYLRAQGFEPALVWLRDADPAIQVVATPDGHLARLVPALTRRSIYVASETRFYPSAPSIREQRERWIIQAMLLGLDRSTFERELGDRGRWHFALFGWRTFGPLPPKVLAVAQGVQPEPLTDADLAAVLDLWDELAAHPIEQLVWRHRLDVWFRPVDGGPLDRAPVLGTQVFESPGVVVYDLRG